MVRRVVDSGDIEVLDLTVPPTDERIPAVSYTHLTLPTNREV